MRPGLLAVAALLASSPALAAERYSVRDAGGFQPMGHAVEFHDRYGWSGYKVDFDFGLDEGGRALTRDSRLTLKIERRRGGSWSYYCRAKGRDAMTANINFLYGKGISIVAECRIPEKEFAKAVDLDPQDVGQPYLVFQVLIRDGKAEPGAQRGVNFVAGGQIESSELNVYAANAQDGLAVLFRSN